MGLSEKIEEMAVRKERERGRKDIEKLFTYLENCDVKGLDKILNEIKDLNTSGLYEKLINAFKVEAYAKGKRAFTEEELLSVRVVRLARENLRVGGLFTTIFTKSMIAVKTILMIYSFIEYTYYMFSGRSSQWDDALNIYFSGLDERLIFALDRFDEVELDDLPEPTPEYFQMLRRVKWKDKKAKKTYDKLTELMQETTNLALNYTNLDEWIKRISTYKAMEDLFIRTIAGCSAVNDGRVVIEAEDVVCAYKTFFKLIKTDVTKYKAIPERVRGIDGYHGNVNSGGYLVCDKCGGYYELQSGESPDDFSDVCECGGELLYKTNLEG